MNHDMNLSTARLRLAPNAAIDLQLHTTFSDGSWTLEALLNYLSNQQFGLAAITDHDHPDSVATIQQIAREKQMPVLVAVEMSSTWQGKLVDLLCFGFDPHQTALSDLSEDLQHRQQENSREVYENLQQEGCIFAADSLSPILVKPALKQPYALVALLKDHGYGLGDPSAGKLIMRAGFKYPTSNPVAIVEATHQSGGVCLLAHPGRTDGFVTFNGELLDQFREVVPIDGLEVYYPLHTPDETTMFLEYAQRHNLLISAGSDSHGPDKPPIKYRAELCQKLLERIGIEFEHPGPPKPRMQLPL